MKLSTTNNLRVKTPNYGTHLWFDDELQIAEVPHAWVTSSKSKTIKWQELNPNWLEGYEVRHSSLRLK